MKKIKLLYDASLIYRLDENSAYRSGIFFVAYNILIELLKNENLDIKLYCDLPNKYLLEKVIENHSEFKNCSIIQLTKLDNIVNKLSKLKYENKAKNGCKLARPFIKLALNITNRLADNITFLKEDNNDYDAYLSPRDKVPNFIKKDKKIKKYTVLHDIIPLKGNNNKLSKKSWFTELIDSLNENDTYFANSEYTKQDFLDYFKFLFPKQIKVIPLSTGMPYSPEKDLCKIKDIKIKYNIPFEKKYVFSLCALEPRKNLPFAVKSFIEFIKKNNINDCLYVLGGAHNGKLESILKNEIPEYENYKDKILSIGYVNDEDMSALYSGAEMFIFPSLYEGFGIPVLEAMQCGCPVITSNTSSLPEVIGDSGIQINPQSEKDLVNAMDKMYFDNDFKTLCKLKGIQRAKQFSWKSCANIIYETIKNGVCNE